MTKDFWILLSCLILFIVAQALNMFKNYLHAKTLDELDERIQRLERTTYWRDLE